MGAKALEDDRQRADKEGATRELASFAPAPSQPASWVGEGRRSPGFWARCVWSGPTTTVRRVAAAKSRSRVVAIPWAGDCAGGGSDQHGRGFGQRCARGGRDAPEDERPSGERIDRRANSRRGRASPRLYFPYRITAFLTALRPREHPWSNVPREWPVAASICSCVSPSWQAPNPTLRRSCDKGPSKKRSRHSSDPSQEVPSH